jgi:A/G-specific adenine glycosylase
MRNQTQNITIRNALLNWFQAHARRLPWRKTQDPYAIWISEVMLQQTQIATVIPYYQRFLQAFPNFERLAAAPFEKIAEQWSGLGYYRRARHLHLAAQRIVREFKGKFPSDYQKARTLPGVGHYTASAVLSIVYNQPLPVLDGNVARVMARLHAWKGHLQQSIFRRRAERKLQALISRNNPGAFNQAMMELGQTVCLPRNPDCGICPLRPWCRAYRSKNPERYPMPRPRRPTESAHLATAIIQKDRKLAFIRGLDEGLMSDLWNFPAAFGKSKRQALKRLQEKLAKATGEVPHLEKALGALRHNITFRSIQVTLHRAELRDDSPRRGIRWFSIADVDRAPVSQLARKIAKAIVTDHPGALSRPNRLARSARRDPAFRKR